MKLNPDKQIVLSDDIVETVASDFSLDMETWQPVEEGIGNIVAKMFTQTSAYYAKFYNLKHSQTRLHDEVVLVDTLSKTMHVPVAAFVKKADDTPFSTATSQIGKSHLVTVTEELQGTHPVDYTSSLLSSIAVAHANIHSTGIVQSSSEPLHIQSDYSYASSQALGELSGVASKVRSTAVNQVYDGWDVLPRGLTHLDLTASNLLVDEPSELTGVIDFEDTCIAPYSFCLAGTLWDILEKTENPDLLYGYISDYESVRPLSSDEMGILGAMIAVRGLITLHGTVLTEGRSSKARHQHAVLQRAALI